jgi:hypothetical protein
MYRQIYEIRCGAFAWRRLPDGETAPARTKTLELRGIARSVERAEIVSENCAGELCLHVKARSEIAEERERVAVLRTLFQNFTIRRFVRAFG